MKKKNLLKVLGCGALALVGTVAMTGCSGINLTDDEISKLNYTIERSDEFMDNFLHLMEKQNDKLNFQEAWRLYDYVTNSLFINENNAMDNLTIKSTFNAVSPSGKTEKITNHKLYKMANGTKVGAILIDGEIDTISYSITDETTGVYFANNGTSSGVKNYNFLASTPNESIKDSMIKLTFYDEDSVCFAEKLDDGSIKIYFTYSALEGEISQFNVNVLNGYAIISAEGRLVKESIITGTSAGDSGLTQTQFTVEYKYDSLTETEMQGYLTTAKNAIEAE